MLLEQEAISRRHNRLNCLKKSAKFPYEKTLESFEESRLQHVPSGIIATLSSCDFVAKKENIIMVGNPGTGKTHLSIGLGLNVCNKEFKTYFTTAANLPNQLIEAQNNNSLGKLMKTLGKVELLILDELSYLSSNRSQSELLFQVISGRSERGSKYFDKSRVLQVGSFLPRYHAYKCISR